MIWDSKTPVIVMLTQPEENGKVLYILYAVLTIHRKCESDICNAFTINIIYMQSNRLYNVIHLLLKLLQYCIN